MKCFVISPIGDEKSPTRTHADEVFKYLIQPALTQFGIEPIRSDHMHDPGKISDQMYRAIFEYDLCIAVLTFANPNVYYELAVAQSAGRPVIALIEKGAALPFDVKDFRSLDYDLSITSYESKTHVARLVKFLERFKENGWRGDDVFRAYRGLISSARLDTGAHQIRITSPVAGATVDTVTVEGTFDSLPEQYELRCLRYYPEQDGFVPHGKVMIDRARKTWKVSRFDVGGQSGDRRGVEVALVGQDAKILLDYWDEAHAVHRLAIEELARAGANTTKWLPAIRHWPSDLLTCDRIEVQRK